VAVASAKDVYMKDMEKVCGGVKPYVSATLLTSEHNRCKETAMKHFHAIRKMGGTTFSEDYALRLDVELQGELDQYLKHNEDKKNKAEAETKKLIKTAAAAAVATGATAVSVIGGIAIALLSRR